MSLTVLPYFSLRTLAFALEIQADCDSPLSECTLPLPLCQPPTWFCAHSCPTGAISHPATPITKVCPRGCVNFLGGNVEFAQFTPIPQFLGAVEYLG